jgi:hypothetical protein
MDKLDKAIEELQKWNKKKLKELHIEEKIVYGRCARCGGNLTSDHKCPITMIEHQDIEKEEEKITTEQKEIDNTLSPFGEWE